MRAGMNPDELTNEEPQKDFGTRCFEALEKRKAEDAARRAKGDFSIGPPVVLPEEMNSNEEAAACTAKILPLAKYQVRFAMAVTPSWSSEIGGTLNSARTLARKLFRQAYFGPNQMEGVEALIELGNTVCLHLETLWTNCDCLPLVEKAALKTNWFPLSYTNLEASSTLTKSEQMGEWLGTRLCPAPGLEKGRRGPKPEWDTKTPEGSLNLEIRYFVQGVLNPGRFRCVPLPTALPVDPTYGMVGAEEKDIIDDETRARLCSREGRQHLGNWSDAFVEKYIKPIRPDLLSELGSTETAVGAVCGEWSTMVQKRLAILATANADEKGPWRALKQLADDALRKHKRLIQIYEA
jgi:hypothetical protein